ncbi:hypothetical protein VTL71DRAFT_11402 [Oculimacula yallundae]|uniref:Major facilitator superfamily (MFS) profile domain-containing protein n=1 Tax=Oculimacula yallundae TaxID=86028 RepID=A0ABR4CQE8_9HELO
MTVDTPSKADPVSTDSDASRDEEKLPVEEDVRHDEAAITSSEFNLRSILLLTGSFFGLFCSGGFVNAFGIFQEYYSNNILSQKSASDISWLGSFNVFCMFGATAIVGYLNDKYGPRIILMAGSTAIVFALFMTSICKQYYQFFLAQGLVLGIGMAFVVLPSMAVVPRYFTKHRGLAMGIVVSGSSIGGVIWPIALQHFFESVGFAWGVRICAFMMIPLLTSCILFIRVPPTSAKDNPTTEREHESKTKIKPDLSILKSPILLLLAAGLFLVYLGLFSPLFYITSWTIGLGLDADMGFYMVSIINAISLLGRILPGLWADQIGTYNIMVISAGLSGIISFRGTLFYSTVEKSNDTFLQAVIGLQGACAAQIAQPQQYGIAMGFVMSILSIAGLIGSPINGQLLNKWQYLGLSLFSGLAMLLGMLVLILAKLKVNAKFLGKA